MRELVEGGVKRIAVPNDYIVGRTLATNVVDKTTGEVLAKANDEITDELLQKLQSTPASATIQTIYTNDLDQGAVHLADAAQPTTRRTSPRPASRSTG